MEQKARKKTKEHSLTVYLNEKDFSTFKVLFSQSSSPSKSRFIRDKLLGRSMTTKYRNASIDDFVERLSQLKEELRAAVEIFESTLAQLKTDKSFQTNHQVLIRIELDRRRIVNIFEAAKDYLKIISDHDLENTQNSAP